MSNLVPTNQSQAPVRRGGLGAPLPRQTSKGLARLEHQTTLRLAGVQAEATVQTDKLHEIDRVSREAMGGQAMLRHWGDTLAAGDPMLADELKFFTDLARMGKGEVIADMISNFCQEGRQ